MKKETNVTFSGRLGALMADRGLGNAALAKAVGISHVAVGNYLDGRLPRAEELLSLASFFNVSADYLLGRDTMGRAGGATGGRGGGLPPETLASLLAELEDVRARCVEAGEMLGRVIADVTRIQESLAPLVAGGGLRVASSSSSKGGGTRADPRARRVSVKDTLPGVEPDVRDRVRDGALRAMRLSRGKGSPDKGSAGATSGNKAAPSPGSARE